MFGKIALKGENYAEKHENADFKSDDGDEEEKYE